MSLPSREVILYGALAEKYGRCFSLAVATPFEAVRALIANFPTFRRDFEEGEYFVTVNRRPVVALAVLEVPTRAGPIEFLPVVYGAGGGNGKAIGMIIAGTILVAGAVALGPAGFGLVAAGGLGAMALSAAASMGVGMVLGGASALLSPTPEVADYSSSRERKEASFLFGGPLARASEGPVIPLIYGRCRVGAIRISGGTMIATPQNPGNQGLDFAAIPVGGTAFNFTGSNKTIGASPTTAFAWGRKCTSSVGTRWQYTLTVDWAGGGSLPNQEHLRVGGYFRSSSGAFAFTPPFKDDWWRDNDGARTAQSQVKTISVDDVVQHALDFSIVGGDEGESIYLVSYTAKLTRIA